MFKKLSLFVTLIPILFVSSPSIGGDVKTYALEFSVFKDLDSAVEDVRWLLAESNITVDRIDVDYEFRSAVVFIIMGGESVRNDLELLFKENRLSLPSDLSLNSVLTNEEWFVVRPVKLAVECVVKGDVDSALKEVKEILLKANIRVWGSVSLPDESRGVVFVRLSAQEGADRVREVLNENQTVLPAGFVINSIIDFDAWLLGE